MHQRANSMSRQSIKTLMHQIIYASKRGRISMLKQQSIKALELWSINSLMNQCVHELMHSRMHALWRYLAVRWLQVAVDCYCPIGLVAVTLHPRKCQRQWYGYVDYPDKQASASWADYYVRQNIARYVFCCMKLCLQHKTPCSAEGCGWPPKSVSPFIPAVSSEW